MSWKWTKTHFPYTFCFLSAKGLESSTSKYSCTALAHLYISVSHFSIPLLKKSLWKEMWDEYLRERVYADWLPHACCCHPFIVSKMTTMCCGCQNYVFVCPAKVETLEYQFHDKWRDPSQHATERYNQETYHISPTMPKVVHFLNLATQGDSI